MLDFERHAETAENCRSRVIVSVNRRGAWAISTTKTMSKKRHPCPARDQDLAGSPPPSTFRV